MESICATPQGLYASLPATIPRIHLLECTGQHHVATFSIVLHINSA
jgi:hypothetical protein